MSLVTTDWVFDNLNSLKIIDASWHMPAQKRNAAEEYRDGHIPNSIFFDLDENSEKDILLIEHIFTEQGELKPCVCFPHNLWSSKRLCYIICSQFSRGLQWNDFILLLFQRDTCTEVMDGGQ